MWTCWYSVFALPFRYPLHQAFLMKFSQAIFQFQKGFRGHMISADGAYQHTMDAVVLVSQVTGQSENWRHLSCTNGMTFHLQHGGTL